MISVVIPAFNEEKYICDALDSIKAQTKEVAEIIVVNDGSTDSTAQKVKLWSKANAQVVLNYIEIDNSGLAAARNKGIEAAKSEWIALLDGDDIWLPEHISTLSSTLEKFPSVRFVFADAIRFGENFDPSNSESNYLKSEKIAPHIIEEKDESALLGKSFQAELTKGSFIPCCSTLINKSCINACGNFDETRTYGEDRECWLRILSINSAAVCRLPVSRVRYHEANKSSSNAIRKNTERVLLAEELLANQDKYKLEKFAIKELKNHLNELRTALIYSASLSGINQMFSLNKNTLLSEKLKFSAKDYLRALKSSLLN